MQPLCAPDLLRSWEQGLSLPPHDRALLLLRCAHPEMHSDDLARLSIGRRDALLIRLRESLFGSTFSSQTDCPQCGEKLELRFGAGEILVAESERDAKQLSVNVGGYKIAYRLPNSLDIGAVIPEREVAARRRLLLQRCILSAVADDDELAVDELPNPVVESIESHMAELDPQANIEIDLSCLACRRSWLAPFDIASFLWTEINVWAKRILQEVHALATSYGWSERDILAMSPTKRQLYLQMVCG
jgi:hypothetical protein